MHQSFSCPVFFAISLLLSCAFLHRPSMNARLGKTSINTDTTEANRLLDTAQIKIGDGRYSDGLAVAQHAEQLMLKHFAPTDARLARAVYAVGLCLRREEKTNWEAYRHRAFEIAPKATLIDKGHLYFFRGMVHLLDGENTIAYRTLDSATFYYQVAAGSSGILHSNAGRCHTNMGYILKDSSPLKALEHFQQAKQILKKTVGWMSISTAYPFHNEGYVYYNMGRFSEAKLSLDTAYMIRQKLLSINHVDLGRTQMMFGLVLAQQGKFEQAEDWLRTCISIAENSGNIQLAAYSRENLSLVYDGLRQYRKSLKNHEEALEFGKKYGDTKEGTAQTLLNIGIAWRQIARQENKPELYPNAWKYYQMALDSLSDTSIIRFEVFNAMGVTYQEQGDFPQAKAMFEKILNLQKKEFGRENEKTAQTWYNLANIARSNKQYPEALLYNDSSLMALNYDVYAAKKQNNTNLFSISQVLAQRIQILWSDSKTKSNTEKLRQLSLLYERTDRVFESMVSSISGIKNRLMFKEFAHTTHEIGIAAKTALWHITRNKNLLNEAFLIAERSKARELLEALLSSDAMKLSNIGTPITDRERSLRGAIASLETAILGDTTTAGKEEKSRKLSQLRLAYDSVLQSIRAQNPVLKTDNTLRLLPWLKDTFLQKQQVFLQFFTGDDSVYIFVVRKNKPVNLISASKDSLDFWVEKMVQYGIRGYYGKGGLTKDEANRHYADAALQLYRRYLEPALRDVSDNSELLIVPDGTLWQIPFDALLTERPADIHNFNTHPFLIKKYRTSLHYSGTLIRRLHYPTRRLKAPNSLLAMAPFAQSGLSLKTSDISGIQRGGTLLDQLKYSGPEVDSVAKWWKVSPLRDTNASVEAFLRLAPLHRILLLSTHAASNSDDGKLGWLALSAGNGQFVKIYAHEIYGLELPADLVVLSACETGIGQTVRGEGVISFARAFFVAGALGVAPTLWSVEDESTKDVTTSFFKLLNDGKIKKDAALHQAKRDFIDANPLKNHPYFWAGMTMIGNTTPLQP